jgi:hypothetical protein
VYDNQTRSMLQTPQRFPRAGSQTYPSPAAVANADEFTVLRIYSPLESFFDKSWKPSEIELVK